MMEDSEAEAALFALASPLEWVLKQSPIAPDVLDAVCEVRMPDGRTIFGFVLEAKRKRGAKRYHAYSYFTDRNGNKDVTKAPTAMSEEEGKAACLRYLWTGSWDEPPPPATNT